MPTKRKKKNTDNNSRNQISGGATSIMTSDNNPRITYDAPNLIDQSQNSDSVSNGMMNNIETLSMLLAVKCGENENLKKIIEENEKTIRDLNSKADLLREEQRKNDAIIKELENSNNLYKIKIDKLNQEIISLNDKFTIQDNKKLLEKYIMAIQDYNSCYFIENKININAKKPLIQLKRNRNGQCHYFDKDYDDPDAIFFVLSEKINNIPEPIKNELNAEYPNVLDGLKELLNNNTLHQLRKPNEDELKYINGWWKV